jgi:predicted secreted protein
MMDVDVTTPGFIRIPVCSPERAFQSWDTAKAGSSQFYLCDIPPGRDECGDSSFENQTSDASASVEDCLQIIKNIEGDASTGWKTQVVGKNQREIASHGSCSFGVEATKVHGNVNFDVGGQDVIDIINDAIRRFGGGGKVGAKGNMECNGNIELRFME